MKQILITKGTIDYAATTGAALTGANNVDLIADGALICVESNGTLVDGTTPTITQDAIYFVMGRTGKAPLITPHIDIASLSYNKLAYTAPVAKIMVVGSPTNGGTTYNLNLPSSPTVGTVASIMLIDETKPHEDRTREKVYEYQVRSGDTAASVAAAIIAKINADANKVATAAEVDTNNHDGFTLTATTAGNDFNVSCDGILINADILGYNELLVAGTAGLTAGVISLTSPVTKNNIGQGTSAQILEAELDFSTEMGNTGLQSRGVNLFNFNQRTVAGATYVQYELTWTTPSDNPLIPKANMTQSLSIAVPSGDTGAGKHIAVIDAILASL